MKPTLLLGIFLLHVFVSCAQTKTYTWTQALPPGNGSFPESYTDGKFPMAIIPLVAFNNDLYMIGQKNIWVSKDGIHWTAYPKTDWGNRYGMTFTYFKGKIWMFGGMKSWDKFCNDIWSTDDGKEWKLVKNHADWEERRGHSVVSFNNKLWLFGGSLSSGQGNKLPTSSLNDVWSSVDGENWVETSKQSTWNIKEPRVIVLNKKLFLIGGVDNNQVWTSIDGEVWTKLITKAKWGARQDFGLLVLDEKIWLFGGRGYNDTWHSTNGKDWVQHTIVAPWSTRTAIHSVVFLNKLWIYSGKTGRDDSWSGDVWTMTK